MAVETIRTTSGSSWKTVVAILALMAVLLAGLAFLVLKLTAPSRHTAAAVFSTIATRGAAVAWQDAAPGFQQAVPEAAFAGFAEAHHLAGFKSTSWNQVSVNNSSAFVGGSVILSDGPHPAQVTMLYIGNRWHLTGLAIDGATIGGPRLGGQPPGGQW